MILGLAVGFAALQTVLQVTNLEAGTEVRHPVVILKGACRGTDIIVGKNWKEMVRFPTRDKRFIALVELRPGPNMLVLQSANETLRFRLDYRPARSPYRVRTIWAAPADGPLSFEAAPGVNPNQYPARLDVAMKLLQAFTAESMREAGYGLKTFALDTDQIGKVKIEVVRSPKTREELQAMDGNAVWSHYYGLVEKPFPGDLNKCVTIMSFTKYLPDKRKALAHTALGGGQLALFGSGSLSTWPSSLKEVSKSLTDPRFLEPAKEFDDSGLRGTVWGSNATTLGAVLHELGHTLGLPHSSDRYGIMSRGFDFINRAFTLVEPPSKLKQNPFVIPNGEQARWDPFHAARLAWNRWLQPDLPEGGSFRDVLPTVIEARDGEFVIKSAYGIRVAGAEISDRDNTFEVYRDDPPRTITLKQRELAEKVGGESFTVYALDSMGNEARFEVKGRP